MTRIGYALVAAGSALEYGHSFEPITDGHCHLFAAKVLFRDGSVRWSPSVKFCLTDHG
jgi:hypothetical protein